MWNFRLVVAISLSLVANSFAVSAESGRAWGEDSGKILALESAWNQAEIAHDQRAMEMLLADGFEYTDSDGTYMSKRQWLLLVKKGTDEYEELGNVGMSVHVYGAVAIVTGGYRQRVKSKQRAPMRVGRFTDVWVLQTGLWKCVASQATLVSSSGKP